MVSFSKIRSRGIITVVASMLSIVACDKLDDVVDSAKTNIQRHLNGQGVYERDNVPENVSSTNVKGYYDILGGAYRYITNEDRAGRSGQKEIKTGDSISFYFDARIFSGTYDNSTTFYTNIARRIDYIRNNNPQFSMDQWSTELQRIKVGGDVNILKALQNSLPSCREGDAVRIFLTPDIAYGSKQVGVVPGKSTLVFELTNIEIIP